MLFNFYTNIIFSLIFYSIEQASCPDDVNPSNNSAQNESRIRVRNWLMLADQSILEKSYSDTTNGKFSDYRFTI